MRYAVAHGRRSGRGGGAMLGSRAVTRLRELGHEVEELPISSLEEGRARCAAAVASGVDVLVVAGGDGLVNLATNLCRGTATAVGILPAGTGNDNARSLGIPLGPEGALSVLVADARRSVDVIEVRGGSGAPGGPTKPHVAEPHVVLASLDLALDARIAARAGRLPRRLGALTYSLATVVEITRLRSTPPLRYRLELVAPDGAVVTRELEALVMVAANMGFVGGGLHVVPEADPTDGLLDLLVIHPVGPVEAVGLLRAARTGRLAELPSVEIVRVAGLGVEGPADVVVHGDGDPIVPLPVRAAVRKQALRVVAPQVT